MKYFLFVNCEYETAGYLGGFQGVFDSLEAAQKGCDEAQVAANEFAEIGEWDGTTLKLVSAKEGARRYGTTWEAIRQGDTP